MDAVSHPPFSPNHNANACSSLDCRHVFCGPCLVTSFNSNGRACPECRTISKHEPKREFSVQGVTSLVFQAQNRELPTPASEGFDTNAFAHMYAGDPQPVGGEVSGEDF